MTKQEFEILTGLRVNDEIFARANQMYMEAGEMSKEDFCAELKENFAALIDSKIVQEIVQKSRRQEEHLDRLHKKIHDQTAVLLSAALDADAEETWEKVTAVLGPVHVIRFKLDNQLELTDADRAYIINHLKDE